MTPFLERSHTAWGRGQATKDSPWCDALQRLCSVHTEKDANDIRDVTSRFTRLQLCSLSVCPVLT